MQLQLRYINCATPQLQATNHHNRKGHWLRLAQTPCPKHDLHTCRDLIQQEDRAIQDRLDKIETLTAQKTVRPDIIADFERKRVAKAKAESDMTIEEALKLPYKRMMRVLALLGFSSAKKARAALATS
jgi:hypothetical protein